MNCIIFQMIRTYYPFTRINASSWGQHEVFDMNTIDFKRSNLFKKFDNLQEFPLRVTIFRRYPTSLRSYELPAAFLHSYLMKEIWRSDGYSGVDGIMLQNAAKSLNFTAINIPQIGIDFGYKASNGTFVGEKLSSFNASFSKSFLKLKLIYKNVRNRINWISSRKQSVRIIQRQIYD